MTIELARDGDGCVLTLTHDMNPQWAAYELRTVAGWTKILAVRADTMGDKQMIDIQSPAPARCGWNGCSTVQ